MGWIKDIGNTISLLTEFEKVGIFCFSVIIVAEIIRKTDFFLPIVTFSFGIILLFLHAGLHKTRIDKIVPNPTNPAQNITETIIGYDFASVLAWRHPYNTIRNLGLFFIVLGTISTIIDYLLILLK